MIYSYKALGSFGALGNQLWQIAGTLGRAERNKADGVLFPKWYYSKFFNVPEELFVDVLPYECVDFSGEYLQDLEGIGNVIDIVLWWFSETELAKKLIDERFESVDFSNMTAIHVRRGNNLSLPNHHPVPTYEYFKSALNIFNNQDIIVFSDDLDWCKEQDIFSGALFGFGPPKDIDIYSLTSPTPVSIDQAAIDLLIMKMCRRHIISNSSLSWWGAYLAGYGDVIYPPQWVGPAITDYDVSRIIPDKWIGLNV